MKLSDLLSPPRQCQAKGMPLRDKRKGFIWYCVLAHRNFAKGRSKPECYCAIKLADARSALSKEPGDG